MAEAAAGGGAQLTAAAAGGVLLLGPGASGSLDGLEPYLEGLRLRGHPARAVSLPRGSAERAIPVFAAAIAGAGDPGQVVAGGHSFGGRVASLAAVDTPVRALVLFSYPLHPPGHPALDRARHWPRLRCPVLLLSGEEDEYARIDLLREAAGDLPEGRLVTFPNAGHGLGRDRDHALDVASRFLAGLAVAAPPK